MSGSWEIREANQVTVAILHVDVTTVAWSFGLRNLIVPGREDLRKCEPFLPVSGMPFDHARNLTADVMLQRGHEWLFCYDSDVIPPKDAIVRLMAWKEPFVSGIYHRRSPPLSVPVAQKDGQWIATPPNCGLIEVDVVGAGCLLIHRSIFEQLPHQRPEAGKSFFDWRVDVKDFKGRDGKKLEWPAEQPPLSEDFTLCFHARRHGVRVMCDTSIQCRHVGYGESTHGQWSALNTHTRT